MQQHAAASQKVELQIGEKTFITSKATLSQSQILTNLITLSEPPYFIDADPTLFEHILRYLRTGIFPLLYDSENGHDEPLYFALLQQAQFYQIPRLQEWIEARTYHSAIGLEQRPGHVKLFGDRQIQNWEGMTRGGDGRIKFLKIDGSRAKSFRCPKENWRHDGNRDECMRRGCIFPGDRMKSIYEVDMMILEIQFVRTAVTIQHELAAVQPEGHDQDLLIPPPAY